MANDQYRQFNCYLVLEISVNATPGEIKVAWRKASLRSHPDRGGSDAAQAKINIAYEVLSDPVQRQAHDIFWRVRAQQSSTSSERPHRDQRTRTSNEHSSTSKSSSTQSFSEFQRRVDSAIQTKKAAAWADLPSIKESRINEFTKQFEQERTTFYVMATVGVVAGTIAFAIPLVWLVAGIMAFTSYLKLKGVDVGGQKVALFANDVSQSIEHAAHQAAAKECHEKATAFEKYNSDLASIVQLTTRASSLDDSEDQVARRLTAALFLSGYNPIYYDGDSRSILFADGDEKLLVRFRHRSGAAVNVTYVERLCELMSFHQASNGLLFCSPGLSGNAAGLAARQRIKSYTLESMNSWIDEILRSDRVGPTGDVLVSLDNLRNFISGIAPRISRWSRRGRRY
jgi:DnaJ domain